MNRGRLRSSNIPEKNDVEPVRRAGRHSGAKSPARTKQTRKSPATSGSTEVQQDVPTRRTSRTKSPGRSKSPKNVQPRGRGRTSGTSKSPRRPKSPGRPKSPARLKHIAVLKGNQVTNSDRPPSSDINERVISLRTRAHVFLDSEDEEPMFQSRVPKKEKPKATVRGRSRTDFEVPDRNMVHGEQESLTRQTFNLLSNTLTRATRSRTRESETVLHFTPISVPKMIGEFSDEDDLIPQTDIKKVAEPIDWRAVFETTYTVWLICIIPLVTLISYFFCNDYHCSFGKVPDTGKYLLVSTWLSLETTGFYLLYLTIVAVLSILRYGGNHITGLPCRQGKFDYTTNGLFIMFVIGCVAISLEYAGYGLFFYLTEHLFHFHVLAILFTVCVSVLTYLETSRVPISDLNVDTVNKDGIRTFFLGGQVNPRFFGLDLKLFVSRVSTITAVLFHVAYLSKSLFEFEYDELNMETIKCEGTVLLYFTLVFIYLIDTLSTEESMINTRKFHHDGFGYATAMGSTVHAFGLTAVAKFVVEREVQFSNVTLFSLFNFFIIGYIIYRISNNQKSDYKKNPYSSSIADRFEGIPTTYGNKLLVSGLWGVVRHPNYLGDIMMNLVIGFFTIPAPPSIFSLAIVLSLIYRSHNDNARCLYKYGKAWESYCQKVPNILVPGIY